MSKTMFAAVVVFVVGVLSPLALGDVKVDDHFDDGVIGTNPTGIGTGFNYWDGQWSATVTEADSKVLLNNPVHGGSRCSIASKDGAALGNGLSRFEFRGVSFAVANNTTSGSTARNIIGVEGSSLAFDYDNGLPTGFWIQFENNSLTAAGGGGGWNGTSVLFYEANDDTKKVLATWTFDTLNWNTGTRDFTPVLDITLDISPDGYELTIEGDTITLLSGSLAGSFAAAGFTSELTEGYAASFIQSENPNVSISFDRIIVTEDVPIALNKPANGEPYAPINQDLSWIVMDPAVTHIDLYFGPENDPNLSMKPAYKKLSMAPATTTTWDTGTLAYSTTYYWKVDAYEPNTLGGPDIKTAGSVWKFTTVGQSATVSAVNPAKTVVDAGTANVTLSVTAVNTTSYQWYKVGTPDAALSDGADFSGTATNTLTIYDVQPADEGQYYCQVDNDMSGTEPVNSVPGLVMTKRLIIHYPMDEVVDGVSPDVVGGFGMTLMTTGVDYPSLVEGVSQLGEGSALSFNNLNPADPNVWGQYASAGDVDMEAMGNGLTIAFWVQWTENNTNWQGIINRRGSWSAANMMWRIDKNPGTGEISFEREGGAGRVATSLVQNNWHYIVATYDIASGSTKMYNNGVRISTGTGFTYGTGADSAFKLGCNNDNASEFFCGKIDDVKIYNYALSAAQIAHNYADIMNVSVCNREGTDDMQFDTNDDCRIDIIDFAELAKDWLNDNRIYPQQ
ncbi:MAG: LamG-like jellyroll fold domain-containing protein [Anaerohalosphaeraceae bacterium]